MNRDWEIYTYKARLDSAIKLEQWEEAARARVAIKEYLLEMISNGSDEEKIIEIRKALADSYERLRLSKGLKIEKGPLSTVMQLLTDGETAAIAVELAPLPQDTACNVKESIIKTLSSGNRGSYSTTDLANLTRKRVETVARALSKLRAEGKIRSRRVGRYVMHSFAVESANNISSLLDSESKTPYNNNEINKYVNYQIITDLSCSKSSLSDDQNQEAKKVGILLDWKDSYQQKRESGNNMNYLVCSK